MKIGAMIPARVASRRLPRKNLLPLGGKPLVCWAVDAVLEADVFDDVTVSTDCAEAADMLRSRYAGRDVRVLLRPDALCPYQTGLDACIAHYLEEAPQVDFFGVFMPTFPFRSVARLRRIDSLIRTRGPWHVVSESYDLYCTGDYYYPKGPGVKQMFSRHPLYCTRFLGAYAYWHRDSFPARRCNFGAASFERTVCIPLGFEESVDIDYAEDMELAAHIARGGTVLQRPAREYVRGDWTLVLPDGAAPDRIMAAVGTDKFQDASRPILILDEVDRDKAHTLRSADLIGLNLILPYRTCDAYMHSLHPDKLPEPGERPQYYASQHYRILRTPRKSFAERHIWSADHDHMGQTFGFYGDADSTDIQPHSFGDILPWDRVVRLADLRRAEGYVSAWMLVEPLPGGGAGRAGEAGEARHA